MKPIIEEDHLIQIEKSLGKKPTGCYKVERLGSKNNPLVVSVYPIVEGKPFPTTYWLTSQELKKQISHIERDGFITELEKEIASSETLKDQLIHNHRQYQSDRLQLANTLNDTDSELFKKMDWEKSGIGGIKDWDHIKCLHLHFAHYLARENIIGEILEKRFNLLKHV